jgi:hypothetical protein
MRNWLPAPVFRLRLNASGTEPAAPTPTPATRTAVPSLPSSTACPSHRQPVSNNHVMRIVGPLVVAVAACALGSAACGRRDEPLPSIGPRVEPICEEAMHGKPDLAWLAPSYDNLRRGHTPVSVTLGELPFHSGRLVSVDGFLHADFEWAALYPSRAAALEDMRRAPWVALEPLWPTGLSGGGEPKGLPSPTDVPAWKAGTTGAPQATWVPSTGPSMSCVSRRGRRPTAHSTRLRPLPLLRCRLRAPAASRRGTARSKSRRTRRCAARHPAPTSDLGWIMVPSPLGRQFRGAELTVPTGLPVCG